MFKIDSRKKQLLNSKKKFREIQIEWILNLKKNEIKWRLIESKENNLQFGLSGSAGG